MTATLLGFFVFVQALGSSQDHQSRAMREGSAPTRPSTMIVAFSDGEGVKAVRTSPPNKREASPKEDARASGRVLPIPTQWPGFKLMQIPTDWPEIRLENASRVAQADGPQSDGAELTHAAEPAQRSSCDTHQAVAPAR
jgi:hypothetical protein